MTAVSALTTRSLAPLIPHFAPGLRGLIVLRDIDVFDGREFLRVEVPDLVPQPAHEERHVRRDRARGRTEAGPYLL